MSVAFATYGLGWQYEAGIQFLRMVLAGVFDQYPKLQVILGHWGEVVLFYLERIERMERVAGLKKPIRDYVQQNLYVTASGMFSEPYMQRCLEIVGADRVLFSTDYPYQYRPGRQARSFLDASPLDADAKAQFAHGNWERADERACPPPPAFERAPAFLRGGPSCASLSPAGFHRRDPAS